MGKAVGSWRTALVNVMPGDSTAQRVGSVVAFDAADIVVVM